ncbi:hypothetical protein N7495_003037 [Penicillium taxi]|uniref:uncharacterized protein n=1 Tax=Penicillium taxi TaxID=168475 RepID=UPI0025451523|nr:uncharacterized protein N7495_003037 [Penicillium taxi]KAJ5902509.1 hypothetical protein N7495_003037 [Penicillium taxi]
MSYPPPNSGQYPQYIPPPPYQPGHASPPQLLYNNVATPSPSPYNGYGKPALYPSAMMPPYSTYTQYTQQPQQQVSMQQHQSLPLIHPHQQLPLQSQPLVQRQQQQPPQQSPRSRPLQQQQSPLLPHQHSPLLQQQPQHQPSPLIAHQQSPLQHQQSPLLQHQHQQFQTSSFMSQQQQQPIMYQQQQSRGQQQHQTPLSQPQQQQQQSPRTQPRQQSPTQISQPSQSISAQPSPSPPPPPPPPPPAEPQHQFINPAELFVQQPLPTAPRSRYSTLSQYTDSILESAPIVNSLPPVSPILSKAHMSISQAPPVLQAPPAQIIAPASPQKRPQIIQVQPILNAHPPQPQPQPKPKQQKQSKQPKQQKQQKQQKQPVIKAEATPVQAKPPSRTELKYVPSASKQLPTLKAVPAPLQSTPSVATLVLPEVLASAPAPQISIMSQTPKKQSKKHSVSQSIEKPGKSSKPPVDYQVLLLALADEYLNAAHNQGTKMALFTQQVDVEEYYKLIATGLGCLEAVLKNWRLQPRKEALVRLRYARTLFEETENDFEAETALSKGIDLCERNRMLDLKYSMQHLLARMLYKTNPKASLKAVDGMIENVEVFRHAAWEYAFRFLRVTLSLSSSSHQDYVQAMQHLHKITAMASRNGDRAVAAMAAIIGALAHLQQGTGSDAIEQAQRAVAAARSHQLNDELSQIPQLVTLIQMVDICCSLLEYDVNQSSEKLKVMQALVDETLNDHNWRPDGSFCIPLSGKSAGPSSMDTGDILQVQNGTLLLSFNWLPQHDLYALSYFLSSITLSAKNSYDGRKAEKYLDEGLRMIQGNTAPQEITESMMNATRRVQWRRSLYCNFLLQRVFLSCARTDWELASQTLTELQQVTQEIGLNLPMPIQFLMKYATGVIAQATGNLVEALAIFQSPLLSISPSAGKSSRNDPCRDICVLALLNTVLIIRNPAHPCHGQLPASLATLETFCQNSQNKYLQAAYHLVCATVCTESTIQTKQYLQQALQSATAISNSQITCMTLTFMSWKYFRGVVGEQAEKSARAGRAMAKRANDRLWASVTDDMLADTLERQGKSDEARGVREEGQRLIMGLPAGLRRA